MIAFLCNLRISEHVSLHFYFNWECVMSILKFHYKFVFCTNIQKRSLVNYHVSHDKSLQFFWKAYYHLWQSYFPGMCLFYFFSLNYSWLHRQDCESIFLKVLSSAIWWVYSKKQCDIFLLWIQVVRFLLLAIIKA